MKFTLHIVTPVRVYTEKNEKTDIVTPMRVYTGSLGGGPLVLLIRSSLRPQIAHSDALYIVTPARIYTRSHQQLPIVTAASIHGKPSKIARSDARESIHGKE